MSPKAKSYQANYQKLKQIAQLMREQEELDIDQLVTLVKDATDAYQKCQARIDAVEKALGLMESEEKS